MSLFDSASLVVTPSGYKEDKLYSIKPTDGSGDLVVKRATTATRVNSNGLIESVANNVPRLDYTNSSCPSILVEPQRTNISNYMESGTGSFNAATVVSAPNILGLTAFKVTTDIGTYGDAPYIDTNSQYQANTPYTLSLYTDFSKCTGSSISMSFLAIFAGVSYTGITVNKTTKAITTFNVGTNWSINNYSATQVNGQIYKIVLTATPNATAAAISRNYIDAGNTFAIEVAGVQTESGSYATSFINKPSSASVTRNADVISKTGISSLIGQTEGTAFVDINLNLSFTESDMRFITISDGSSANWYFIGTNNSNEIRFYFRAGAITYVSELLTLTSGRHKLAFAYKNNDYIAYADGVQIYSTTSLAVGSTTSFDLGKSFGSSGVSKQFINSAILWKERLSNETLAQLTTI